MNPQQTEEVYKGLKQTEYLKGRLFSTEKAFFELQKLDLTKDTIITHKNEKIELQDKKYNALEYEYSKLEEIGSIKEENAKKNIDYYKNRSSKRYLVGLRDGVIVGVVVTILGVIIIH